MSAMEPDEYDEDYKEEATIEYRGLAMEEAEVLRPQEMSLDDTYKRLDDVYFPLNDNIERLTTRMDELKEKMYMIRRQNAIRTEATIDGLTRLSIDGGYEYLKNRLVTVK
ncbi:hypothetical protein HID58_075230, partial [Brassica napus]